MVEVCELIPAAEVERSELRLIKLDRKGPFQSGLWGLWSDRGALIQIDRPTFSDDGSGWRVRDAFTADYSPVTMSIIESHFAPAEITEWAARHGLTNLTRPTLREVCAIARAAWAADTPKGLVEK